jgi:hypothetical protein
MYIRALVISAICICIATTSAFSAPKSLGDTGGIKGATLNNTGCVATKCAQWQIARGKRNPTDQG